MKFLIGFIFGLMIGAWQLTVQREKVIQAIQDSFCKPGEVIYPQADKLGLGITPKFKCLPKK